ERHDAANGQHGDATAPGPPGRPQGIENASPRPSAPRYGGDAAMPFAKALHCRECGREYPLEPTHVCEFCFGPLEVTYDYAAMHRTVTREPIQRGPAAIW